jgi:nucleolar protein 56
MRALVSRSPIGFFAFLEKGDLLYYKLFSKDSDKAVEALGELPEDFTSSIRNYEIKEGREADRLMRKRLREYAISLGFVKNDKELNEFLSAFGIALSRKRMKGLIARDRLLIQASCALEDMSKIVNLLLERLHEWYSLHYPELKLSQKDILDKIIKYGRRENYPDFKESTGTALTDTDEKIITEYANTINNVIEQRKDLENYVKETAKEVMPNFASLTDQLLAAKLLAAAGSLEKLARMPASTIQLIGAEKALFRHLRKQGKSPKFGLLFMDSRVQNAADEKKGKVARLLASKLMLAARIDFYSARDESEKMRKDLEEEIKAIK